mmetsp:Transcript_28482/g.53383  ORF Transcript_28482/g.53383 Transcript_28482/m.53383 type:complete len:344 (-) Transcript_28482:4097-5128(-)
MPMADATSNSMSHTLLYCAYRFRRVISGRVDIHRVIRVGHMRPARQPRETFERQHHSAHNRQEHAHIKEGCGGQFELFEGRNTHIGKVRGQERLAHKPRADAGQPRDQNTCADHPMIGVLEARRGPGEAAGHILHDNTNRHDEARDKPAPRFVVAPQEDVETNQHDNRHDHPREHHHHHRMHVTRARLVRLAVQQTGPHRPAEQRLGQGIDQQGRNPQNDDLAIGVKAPEVDEDHVHNVGAPPTFVGIGQMELGDRRRDRIAQQIVIGQPECGKATGHSHARITHPAQDRAFDRGCLGQEVQRKQEQNDRHHLDGELRHGQIRRAEEHESDRDHKPDNPDQDQ